MTAPAHSTAIRIDASEASAIAPRCVTKCELSV